MKLDGETKPILTAKAGTNADLFPDILKLYVPEGSRVLDMTYGKGVFWKNVNVDQYDLITNDIHPEKGDYSYDFRELPSDWADFDAVVFDPPYKLTGTPSSDFHDNYGIFDAFKSSGNRFKSTMKLYQDGMQEAWRVLKDDGVLIVKCMDQVEWGRRRWAHIQIYTFAMELGMTAKDLLVMVRTSATPQPYKFQRHARQNHSYFWVFIK